MLPAGLVVNDRVIGDLIWHLSLPVVRDRSSARRYRHRGTHFSLEGFHYHLLELIGLMRAQPFVGTVGQLLGLETDAGVKLHLESLTGLAVYPVAAEQATRHRYAIRGYLSTAAKHGINVLAALRDALESRLWMPPVPDPP